VELLRSSPLPPRATSEKSPKWKFPKKKKKKKISQDLITWKGALGLGLLLVDFPCCVRICIGKYLVRPRVENACYDLDSSALRNAKRPIAKQMNERNWQK